MYNKCSSYAPQLRKTETIAPTPTAPDSSYPTYPMYPMYPSSPYMPDTITPTTPINPINPINNPATPMPQSPEPVSNPSNNTGNVGNQQNIATPIIPPTQVNPSIPMNTTINPQMPYVLPESPLFSVPTNLLLPPGYQEILSYESLQYLNGFLRTQIGKICDVQLLIGSNSLETRTGRLVGVGLNYILLLDIGTNDVLSCDYYAIKFVRFHSSL